MLLKYWLVLIKNQWETEARPSKNTSESKMRPLKSGLESRTTTLTHLLLCRSTRAGLCDAGLPPALLPQHHLRRHRRRCHLRPGGGAAGSGCPPPEEAQCPAAQRRQRESAPPPPAPAAVPPGHTGPGTRPRRRSGSLPRLRPPCSGPVPLQSPGPAAAVRHPVPLGALCGLSAVILTSCSGLQVRE